VDYIRFVILASFLEEFAGYINQKNIWAKGTKMDATRVLGDFEVGTLVLGILGI
jgi:hypothetical protein